MVVKPPSATNSPLLNKNARPAWVPIAKVGKAQGTETRYNGSPWMPTDMEWPLFEGQPMKFVMQLNSTGLPAELADGRDQEGLLLFFHGDGYDPDEQSLVVMVDPNADGGLRPDPVKGLIEDGLIIADWRKVIDHEGSETFFQNDEAEKFEGFDDLVSSDTIGEVRAKDGNLVPEAEFIKRGLETRSHTFECDKIGGWPAWEQGDETPEDSEGDPMEFVMQIGHQGLVLEDGLDPEDIEWPTWGRGHIFHSPRTGEFKYVWACD